MMSNSSNDSNHPELGLFIVLPEREPTLTGRMLAYVHSRSAIAKARGLAFWEMFRRANRDLAHQLKPSELRFMFFAEVLHEPDYCDEPTVYDGWYEEGGEMVEGGHDT